MKSWIDAGARDDSTADGESRREEPKTIVLGDLPPGVQPINAVDLTADGARVAAGRANVVQVYDVDSGLEIVSLGGHKDLIQSLRFSPDGTLLAAGSYQIVTIWTAPTGQLAKSLPGHGGPVLALAVAPDGATAYSGGQDKTIRVWNLAGGEAAADADPAGGRSPRWLWSLAARRSSAAAATARCGGWTPPTWPRACSTQGTHRRGPRPGRVAPGRPAGFASSRCQKTEPGGSGCSPRRRLPG